MSHQGPGRRRYVNERRKQIPGCRCVEEMPGRACEPCGHQGTQRGSPDRCCPLHAARERVATGRTASQRPRRRGNVLLVQGKTQVLEGQPREKLSTQVKCVQRESHWHAHKCTDTGGYQSVPHAHTHAHTLSSFLCGLSFSHAHAINVRTGISDAASPTCPSLLQEAIYSIPEELVSPLLFSLSPSLSLSLSVQVPALYGSFLVSPPLYLPPSVLERRGRRGRGSKAMGKAWLQGSET